MRCAGALPSIKNVRGRSPRPIWVMTSSTRRHGTIHSRHTMKATTPNAPQIKTTMSQDTAFLFSSKYFSQQSGCEDVAQFESTAEIVVRPGSSSHNVFSEGGASWHRFHRQRPTAILLYSSR